MNTCLTRIDSNVEAFSRNETDGSFEAVAVQVATYTKYLKEVFLVLHLRIQSQYQFTIGTAQLRIQNTWDNGSLQNYSFNLTQLQVAALIHVKTIGYYRLWIERTGWGMQATATATTNATTQTTTATQRRSATNDTQQRQQQATGNNERRRDRWRQQQRRQYQRRQTAPDNDRETKSDEYSKGFAI